MSLLVTLTPEGEIVDYQITPSLIRVAERLTYQDADARIGHEPRLTQGFEIAQRLRQSRFDNGDRLADPADRSLCRSRQADHRAAHRPRGTQSDPRLRVHDSGQLAGGAVLRSASNPHSVPRPSRPRETFPTSLTYDPVLHYRQQRAMSPAESDCSRAAIAAWASTSTRPSPHPCGATLIYCHTGNYMPIWSAASRCTMKSGSRPSGRKSKLRSAGPGRSITTGDATGSALSRPAPRRCVRGHRVGSVST